MADFDTAKSLSGLLNGIAQNVYYRNTEITEELLKNELYPDLLQEEFNALHDKMKGLLKVKRHLHSGASYAQMHKNGVYL